MSSTEQAKPVFGPESLAALVAQINERFPSQLQTDWRTFIKAHFQLSPEQEQSFEGVPPYLVEEIQHHFVQAAQHLKQGGKLRAKIVKRPPERQTAAAVHEVHLDVDSPRNTAERGIIIAHCDANCQNWGWGPG